MEQVVRFLGYAITRSTLDRVVPLPAMQWAYSGYPSNTIKLMAVITLVHVALDTAGQQRYCKDLYPMP